ncbi:MAG: CpsD/CapB family tyrosine-protein kinase [Gammaproteobacteria bacterium]|nr:CpsD/CapB family tyrosine-protein kinase [Gammaproteobacteria bacterium]MBQ0840686.1 CpsD/CapB family tyrosine-protein kinase [Gammaproteobacteria bacterium]
MNKSQETLADNNFVDENNTDKLEAIIEQPCADPRDKEPCVVVSPSNVRYTQTRTIDLDQDHLNRHRVLTRTSEPEVVAAFKLLRTQVLQRLGAKRWNSIGVVSAHANEGKTLTAINLAVSIARDYNRTALLADFDLSQPSVHKYLGFEPELGLDNYLQGQCDLADVLVNPGSERLVLLPVKDAIIDASEILASPAVISLAEELRQRYSDRVIVYDLPPLLDMDEALAFLPYVDALLIVVEERHTTAEDLHYLSHILGDKPVLGTVLNKSRP